MKIAGNRSEKEKKRLQETARLRSPGPVYVVMLGLLEFIPIAVRRQAMEGEGAGWMDGRAARAGGVATMGRQGEGEGEIACIGSDSDDPGKGRGGAGRSTEALHPPPSLPSVASRRSSRSHGIEGNVPEFRRFLKGVASSSSSLRTRARMPPPNPKQQATTNREGAPHAPLSNPPPQWTHHISS